MIHRCHMNKSGHFVLRMPSICVECERKYDLRKGMWCSRRFPEATRNAVAPVKVRERKVRGEKKISGATDNRQIETMIATLRISFHLFSGSFLCLRSFTAFPFQLKGTINYWRESYNSTPRSAARECQEVIWANERVAINVKAFQANVKANGSRLWL